MAEHDNILSSWLAGNASDEEVRDMLGDVDLENLRSVLETQENLEISATDPMSQWDSFEAKLGSKNPSSDSNATSTSAGPRRWIILGLILLVGALLAAYFLSDKKEVVEPKVDMRFAFEDGSTAEIRAGSKIRFDKATYASQRHVELQGQAFFEVEKGASFVVETDAGEIQVLGTSFDVWAIDKKAMEVKCHTGRVQVRDNADRQVILTAGERVMIEEKQIGTVGTFDLTNQAVDRQLKQYDNALISWVISDLERIYGTSIDISSELGRERFSGVIATDDLDRALVYLCETMQWSYDQRDKSVFITAVE